MRIALDSTPALVQRAGVGRYARGLLHGLALSLSPDDHLILWHGCGLQPVEHLPSLQGSTVHWVAVPIPARVLPWLWYRASFPLRLEQVLGPIDVNHGLDFVVAPSRAPSVVTIHDLSFLVVPQYAHPQLRAYLASAVPRTLQRVAAVIAVSEQVRREIAAFYSIPDDRIVAIPHGVEPRFRPPSAAAIAATLSRHGIAPPYFLAVGTIEPRKNHQTLLAAFAAVAAVDPAVQLVVVGRPGWLCRGIVQQLQVWERRGRLKWLHTLADDDLPALYAGCVALVYPSWYEGFGFPVLEAMACGAPVIASDLPVLRDVAGEAAMYVPAGDAEALGAAMQRLLTDQSLREQLRTAGLIRAQQFTWEASAARHLAVYRAVAEMRR